MSFKPFTAFLTASLVAHAAFAVAAYSPLWNHPASKGDIVTISYVAETPQAPKETKELSRRLRKQASLARRSVKEPVIKIPAPLPKGQVKTDNALIRESGELLQDPKKGKVFAGYFGQIKEKIGKTIRRRYSEELAGRGDVSLVFVLRADGSLEDVAVRKQERPPEIIAEDFAVQCVRNAAPFKPFPKELGLIKKIYFNVTLLFNEA